MSCSLNFVYFMIISEYLILKMVEGIAGMNLELQVSAPKAVEDCFLIFYMFVLFNDLNQNIKFLFC